MVDIRCEVQNSDSIYLHCACGCCTATILAPDIKDGDIIWTIEFDKHYNRSLNYKLRKAYRYIFKGFDDYLVLERDQVLQLIEEVNKYSLPTPTDDDAYIGTEEGEISFSTAFEDDKHRVLDVSLDLDSVDNKSFFQRLGIAYKFLRNRRWYSIDITSQQMSNMCSGLKKMIDIGEEDGGQLRR